MTFTVLGRCARSGKTGYAQATSTPAVGWRCTDVVPGYGVLTVQAHGDYRQLQRAKALLQTGQSPEAILETLCHEDAYFTYRQIALLLNDGRYAVHTGPKARPWAGEIVSEHMIVTGNVLVGPPVLEAMAQAWARSVDVELEERLLRCVEAGRDAGGQEEGQTSCALEVFDDRYAFPIVNLRIDVSLEPIAEMRKIFNWFQPLIPYYIQRTLDPSAVAPKKAFLEQHGLPVNPYVPT